MIKKVFFNTLANGLQFGSRWILNLSLAKKLPNVVFGEFSYFYSIANVLFSIICFGANVFLLKSSAYEKEKAARLLLDSHLLSIIVFVITLPVTIFFVNNYILAILINLLAFLWGVLSNNFSFLKGLGKFKKESIYQSVYAVLILAFSSVLFFSNLIDASVNRLLLVLIAINFVLLLLSSFSFYKEIKESVQGYVFDFGVFGKRFFYAAHELSSILLTNFPILFIGYFFTQEKVAMYKAVQVLIIPVLFISTALMQVFVGQLSAHVSNIKEYEQKIKKSLLYIIAIVLTIGFFGYIFSGYVFEFVYENKFDWESTSDLFYVLFLFSLIGILRGFLEASITALGHQNIRFYTIVCLLFLVSVFLYFYRFTGDILFIAQVFMSLNMLIVIIYAITNVVLLKRMSLQRSQ